MSWKSRFARMERSEIAGFSIFLAIVLFFALNIIASVAMRAQSVDLTQDHLFTVTDTTKHVLADLKEPVTIRLFQSHTLLDAVPRLKLYADRVGQLLTTYQQLSGGKLQVERIDPVSLSPEEDRAIGYGIRGFLVDQSGDQGYFGLVGTNSTDGIEKIEFLDPDRDQALEYDLTTLVGRLAHPDKPKVGLIDGLQMAGSMQLQRQPWAIFQTISKNYQVENMASPSADFSGIDALLIAHPSGLPPQTLYAIDQYVLSGKSAAIFIDPAAENSPRNPRLPMIPQATSSDLGPLLAAWGIDWDPKKVVGDPNLAVRVQAVVGRRRVIANYLPWIQLGKENFNHDDVLTADLQLMRFQSAGALQLTKDATTKLTPLIQTTPQAGFLDSDDVVTQQDPTVLLDKFKSGNTPLVLAARLTGEAKSGYPDGLPPDPSDPHAPPRSGGLKSGAINLVLVADSDLLSDNLVGADGDAAS
ncbi:MAG TPA: GldG family protein, partial [Beijerinckiaceae bacterium]|nr:GldG family protein [Beijerinckiaceae bacterium]